MGSLDRNVGRLTAIQQIQKSCDERESRDFGDSAVAVKTEWDL